MLNGHQQLGAFHFSDASKIESMLTDFKLACWTPVMPPSFFDLHHLPLAVHFERDFSQLLFALRVAAIQLAQQLSAIPTGAPQTADRYPVFQCSSLFQNFQREPPILLHACGAQQRSDRTRGPPLLADDFTQISRRHTQFQNRNLFTGNLTNRYLAGVIDENLGDLGYQFFHCHYLAT